MYEQYFSTFISVDRQSPFCIIRLKEPYEDVEILLARTFTVSEDGVLHFDYEITGIPPLCDMRRLQTAEFYDFVKHIFMAILENELSPYAEDETSNTDQEGPSNGGLSSGPNPEAKE